ncbi:MAG: hypothetical protein RSA40_03040 [Malacoplasma sp.]
MDFTKSLNKIKNSSYFSNIYITTFILLSFLLLFSLLLVFTFDFDTSLFSLDLHIDDNSKIAMGMYLVTTIDTSALIPIYNISISYFGIFSLVLIGIIIVLLIFYYPIFKNKTIVINMFYVTVANLVSITFLLACFPTTTMVPIFLNDTNNPGVETHLYDEYIFTTILFDKWKIIFLSEDMGNGNVAFEVFLKASITWFYILKYMVYAISAFTIIFSSFIIVKELYAGKKFFLDPYIKQLANFNN